MIEPKLRRAGNSVSGNILAREGGNCENSGDIFQRGEREDGRRGQGTGGCDRGGSF